MKTPFLEFYFFEECPYCQRVLNVIKDLKVKVAYRNIYSDINEMHKLHLITGRKTVPCLFIDGSPMHESLDIMNWLKANIDTLDKDQ